MTIGRQGLMSALATLAIVFSIPVAHGQSQDQRDRDQQRQQQRDDQRSQRSDARDRDQAREGQQDRQSQSRRDRDGRQALRATPEGWITIGADYDDDGRFDAIERIYVYDLQQAQNRSRQRQRAGEQVDRRQRQDDSRTASRQDDRRSERFRRGSDHDQRRGDRQQQMRQPQTRQVEGTIQNVLKTQFAGKGATHVLAKVQTQDDRTLTAVLGTEQDLSRLNLQEGQRVQLRGVKVRVNDRPVLMATNVRQGDQSVSNSLSQRVNLKRVKANVLDTRTVRFRGLDEQYVVGRVELQEGDRMLVNFGPESTFDQVGLQSGDEVRILARPGRVNGQQALIVQSLRANGRSIDVPRPEDRRRFARGDRRGGDQQNRGDRNRRERVRDDLDRSDQNRDIRNRDDRNRDDQNRDRDRDRQRDQSSPR